MEIHDASPRAIFKLVTPDELPPGVAVDAKECQGLFEFLISFGHMSRALRDDINVAHKHITLSQLWLQDWDDAPDRLHPTDLEDGSPHPEVEWVILPMKQFSNGRLCAMLTEEDDEGKIVKVWWLICRGDNPDEPHMTEQCRTELNHWMRVVVERGLWVVNEGVN